MSFSQLGLLEIETYNIIHNVSNLHSSAPDCALSLSPGKGEGDDRNKQRKYLDLLSVMFSYVLPLLVTINVLWPNAVEPLPECPNVLWSEIQMDKLVLERRETVYYRDI